MKIVIDTCVYFLKQVIIVLGTRISSYIHKDQLLFNILWWFITFHAAHISIRNYMWAQQRLSTFDCFKQLMFCKRMDSSWVIVHASAGWFFLQFMLPKKFFLTLILFWGMILNATIIDNNMRYARYNHISLTKHNKQ